MSLHSDRVSWFRDNQTLLFLLNAVCLTEKQQSEQGEKLIPNTFIMFGFFYLFTGLNPVHMHTPTWFQEPDEC
jgi:hypothetical protein